MCKADCSRVTHPSATNPEILHSEEIGFSFIVRLACVKHAASVRPEPGSNSRLNGLFNPKLTLALKFEIIFNQQKIDWFKSFFSLLFSFACPLVFPDDLSILPFIFYFVKGFLEKS